MVLHNTSFIVFDVSKEPAQRLYTVENKFPKLLSARVVGTSSGGAGIVSLNGEDHLVLVGQTNWREELTNPHIAVYNLQTGQRVERFNYQFNNEPYSKQFPVRRDGSPSFTPWLAKIGINNQNDILVTVYASRDTANPEFPTRTIPREDVVWVVNLNTKKVICQFETQQSTLNSDGVSKTSYRHFLAGNTVGTQMVYTGPFKQTVYDIETCIKLHEMSESMADKQKGTVRAEEMRISGDGQWVFGFNYNELQKDKAPFKLWRLSDGKLLHDGYWPFVLALQLLNLAMIRNTWHGQRPTSSRSIASKAVIENS